MYIVHYRLFNIQCMSGWRNPAERERAGKPQATFIPDLEKDKTEEGHIVGGGRREGLLGRGRGGGRREARGEVEASLRS